MNVVTLGWIEYLESARRDRTAGKVTDKVNPEVRPGRQTHTKIPATGKRTGTVADNRTPNGRNQEKVPMSSARYLVMTSFHVHDR